MALTQISTGGVKDDAVTAGKIPANAIGSSEIANDAVDQGAIADEAVDEARLQISNAGSNGQFLQKQSGNTGGLTWATATTDVSGKANLSGADFTGEVALKDNTHQLKFYDDDDSAYLHFKAPSTVASNVNWTLPAADGSTGQYLKTDGSGNLSFSTVTIPPAGNTFTATAEGAIAANKPVYLSRTNGKVIQAAESTTTLSTPQAGNNYAVGPSDTRNEGFCSIGGNNFWFGYKNGGSSDRGFARLGVYNSSGDTFSFTSNTQFSSNDTTERITPVYDSTANRFMVVYRSGTGNSRNLSYIVGNLSGTTLSYGTQAEFQSTSGSQDHQHGKSLNGAFDSNNRGCCWIWQRHYNSHETYVRGAQISTSANSASLGSRTAIITGQNGMYGCDIVFDSNVNRYLIAYAYYTTGNEYKLGFKVGNPSSGTSISWGTEYTISHAANTVVRVPKLEFDPDSNLVLCIANDNTNDNLLQYPLRITGGSTNTVVLADSNGGTVVDSAGSGDYEIKYDTLANKMVLFFRDTSNSGRPTAKFGTYSENYSGTNDYYTWSSSTELSTVNMNASGSEPSGSDTDPATQPLAVLPAGGRAFGYYSNGAQRVSIIKSSNTTHNLTGHDYVGFPDAAYSDGQTVTVKTEGNVQSGFSGLTSMTTMYGDTQNNVGSASSGNALAYQNLGKALGTDKIHIKVAYQ